MTRTLLLADDSVTIQRVIELTFADEDISVLAVSDGDRAIAVAARTPPDIVLADVGMPGRNGYEVARHFKTTPALAHIPVLLLTGAFEPVDVDKAKEAGCDGVLTKPFEPQAVIRRVKELLGVHEGAPAPGAQPSAPGDRPQATPDASAPKPSAAPAMPAHPELDEYFERLDHAFAARAQAPVSSPPSWAPSEPIGSVSDASDVAPAPEPLRPPESQPSAPTLQPQSVLGGAFSALLAAEHAAPDPRRVEAWLPMPPRQEIGDDVIERVVSRVLDRLSDRVVRDAVAETVSATAERVVREEIERIKSNIK